MIVVRDFTEATKERLSKEIDDINKKTWNPVTDAIGDTFLYAGKWIGILSLNDDMSNVESYQRKVLDMTDMTKKDLKKIFDDVYSLDKEYERYFCDVNDEVSTYDSKIKDLTGMIQPNFSICDAKTIKSMMSDYNDKLKNIGGKINKDFNKEIDKAARNAALEATKGVVGGILKTVVDVVTLPVSMVKNICTGNFIGIFEDGWSIIDDVFSVGSNLFGLTAIGIGYGIDALTGYKEGKNYAITQAEAYSGSKGLTDTLEAEEKVYGKNPVLSGMKRVSQKVDTTSAVLGLYSDAKGFFKDPSKMVDAKFGFKGSLSPLKEADMLSKYQKDYQKWNNLYEILGKDYHYIKMNNISKGYKYLECLWDLPEGDDKVIEVGVQKVFKGSNKWFKSFCDVYDLGETIINV
ncbi:MAG: hypothetical protein HFF01_00430 [Erysipelotrichaceae bacterium]|nr:hypothetical protein [Erysipelotrichaceae bacterium]